LCLISAATTFDICKLIGEATALSKKVKIVTLLQPPPETFVLFDELILLSEGMVIYSGPIEQVVPHFESLGYELPDRMDPADWLQVRFSCQLCRLMSSLLRRRRLIFLFFMLHRRTTHKQALPTKDGEEFLKGKKKDEGVGETTKHLTSEEFRQKFYESDQGKQILEKIDSPFEITEKNKALNTDKVKKWYSKRYRNTSMGSLKLLIYR
jgi:ABC-type multidrug transport system ATPase subunit